MDVFVVNVTPRALYPREKDGTHFTGGWLSTTAVLEWGEKSSPNRGSNIIPSRPWPIATLITLVIFNAYVNIKCYLQSMSREIFCMK